MTKEKKGRHIFFADSKEVFEKLDKLMLIYNQKTYTKTINHLLDLELNKHK